MKRKRTIEELQELANQAIARGQESKELRLIAAVTLERAAEWLRVGMTTIFRHENGTEPLSPERYAALKSFYFQQIAARQARAEEIAGKGTK